MDTPEKNITRAMEALSPYINNPRKTVIRIEAFVGLAAALFFLQFILGVWRRRSGHWIIQGGLWLCYTASFPLIAYTLGLMASSPIKNGLYPLWATLLFWAAGCTNSVTAYALEDNKQWKRYLFETLQYYAYSLNMLQLDNTSKQKTDAPIIPLLLLMAVLPYTNFVRVTAGKTVTNSSSSKVVADYMHAAYLGARGGQGTLEVSIYLVKFPTTYILNFTEGPNYITELPPDEIITVDKIREASRQFGDRENGVSLQWKDVCLSFALSELLKRRFYGMECAEANLPETRDFVLNDLLEFHPRDNARDYTRAFEIIEVELGFLYDFFFTRYAASASFGMIYVIFMAALKLILISICGAFLLQGLFTIKTSKPVIEVGTTTVDNIITVVIIGALCLIEVLQVILYVSSDWTIVSLACSYIQGGTLLWKTIVGGTSCKKIILSVISCLRRFNLSRTKFGQFLNRLNLFGYWQNKMGQSSVFEGFLDITAPIYVRISVIVFFQYVSMDGCGLSVRYPRKTFRVVSGFVKSEIVSALKKHCEMGGPLTNGTSALERDDNFREFTGTLSNDNDSQTMIMLIWHIATEYCRIASSGVEAEESDPHRHRDVAITLSRYCAYLMSFLPDLLPGNSSDTEFVSYAVLMEANMLIEANMLHNGREPITKEILLEAIRINSTGNNNEGTDDIVIKGLKLGRDLENKGADHWKMLAEFWAETIIFIAPSDNTTAHMERLAQGGEFLTHIWALLNHAGILTREQNLPPQVVPQP